jgi:hypothetical protein
LTAFFQPPYDPALEVGVVWMVTPLLMKCVITGPNKQKGPATSIRFPPP